MIEYELRKVALEHALTLDRGGHVGNVIATAKRLEEYLLYGLKHKEPEKRDRMLTWPEAMSETRKRFERNAEDGGQGAAADHSVPKI